ncbi:MAG: hypothetical protein CM1200mP9_03770 [Gammaproteobacteria bacterium]|nr:MAG: hypothetical protein CM1200mP9_03770 [Gammaproteobacteria bacterium]
MPEAHNNRAKRRRPRRPTPAFRRGVEGKKTTRERTGREPQRDQKNPPYPSLNYAVAHVHRNYHKTIWLSARSGDDPNGSLGRALAGTIGLMPSSHRLFVGLILLQGCGVTYQLPVPPSSTLNEAANEIRSTPAREPVAVALSSAEKRIGAIERRLQPATQELCLNLRERAPTDCRTWQISVVDEDEINAYATGTNDVFVHRGVIEYARNDDEVALVVAHELSHHLLNHLSESAARNILGSLIGAGPCYHDRWRIFGEPRYRCRSRKLDCQPIVFARPRKRGRHHGRPSSINAGYSLTGPARNSSC